MNALDIVLVVQAVVLVLLAIMLQQLILLKRQFTRVVKEVTAYVSYITEEEIAAEGVESAHDTNSSKRLAQSVPSERELVFSEKKQKEEMDNGIIQAVLSQYFP